jgi:ATP-dependent helicase HrpA
MEKVRARWNQYLERKRGHDAVALLDAELELLRWMIEEWRVAVFSQELGTAMPVSERRVEKQMEKVRRV